MGVWRGPDGESFDICGAAASRQVKQAEALAQAEATFAIPESLRPTENDTEAERERKRKKIKVLKVTLQFLSETRGDGTPANQGPWSLSDP